MKTPVVKLITNPLTAIAFALIALCQTAHADVLITQNWGQLGNGVGAAAGADPSGTNATWQYAAYEQQVFGSWGFGISAYESGFMNSLVFDAGTSSTVTQGFWFSDGSNSTTFPIGASVGVGFASIATSGVNAANSLGFLVGKTADGYAWTLYNGTTALTTGSTSVVLGVSDGAGYHPFNTISLTYDNLADTVSASINGTPILTNYAVTMAVNLNYAVVQAGGANGLLGGNALAVNSFTLTSTNPIPEPATSALLLTAIGIGFALKRGRKVLQ